MIAPLFFCPLLSEGEGSGVRGNLPFGRETVVIHSREVLNRFVPALALGAGIDGGDEGETARVFTPHNERAMATTGLGALTYRLRTELAGEAWHWNPAGRFSQGNRGYWTSSSDQRGSVRESFGYRLPRRGNTFDQANDDGYSRLDDGRTDTFWKSNPYLDDRPQWLLLDLGSAERVDTLRIRWAEPYALRYRMDYWDGTNDGGVDAAHDGVWRSFPVGEIAGQGGEETRRLGPPRRIRFVRLTLLASSHTPALARDPRDAKGFAIWEIGVGRIVGGHFVDLVRHRPDHRQTPCYVSSTDPWHRAIDRDPNVEQPGLDIVARSRLARGLPMLLPMPALYGTPEDDAALARWLKGRGYPLRGFEMGEEPDGQICTSEDYAALYLRMADAIRPSFPNAPLGGPAFQTIEVDYADWALVSPSPSGLSWRGGQGERSWLQRFIAFLEARGRRRDLSFVSFEWYPFDEVWRDPAPQLAQADTMLRAALARLRPAGVPLLMTEYGYSAFTGPAEVDLPGALLNLDLVGTFLSEGGRAAFLYGYPPAPLITEGHGAWGNFALALSRDDGQWRQLLPTYWAARMLTQDWCGTERSACALLKTDSPDPLVAAYSLRRPDSRFAVLLLNKDPRRTRTLNLAIDGQNVLAGSFVRYGRTQYAWRSSGSRGHALRSLAPERSHFAETIVLPPYSFAVATF